MQPLSPPMRVSIGHTFDQESASRISAGSLFKHQSKTASLLDCCSSLMGEAMTEICRNHSRREGSATGTSVGCGNRDNLHPFQDQDVILPAEIIGLVAKPFEKCGFNLLRQVHLGPFPLSDVGASMHPPSSHTRRVTTARQWRLLLYLLTIPSQQAMLLKRSSV